MTRRLGFVLPFLVALAAPSPLAAQAPTGYLLRVYFPSMEGTGDSAFMAPAGSNFDVRVFTNDWLYNVGLTAFTVRIHYDASKLTFVTARSSCPDSVASPLQTPVLGPNYVELSATGCVRAGDFVGYGHALATVTFQMQAGATSGSVLHLEPRALTDRNATNRSGDGDGDVDEVCLAVGRYGDVDDDGQVNSRDALIALSNAVGLPTPGFQVSRGDVDGDGYVGSRDALGMLSASIGYPPASGFRTGRGIPTACAPQVVLPRAVYDIRNGAMPGLPGVSGLVIRAAGDSTETIVGDSAEANINSFQRPRVSPDGSRVLFACYWQYYYDVCRANADGSGLVNLTQGSGSYHGSFDWSPAGDSVLFVRSGQMWMMSAQGLNQHLVPGTSSNVEGVAWDPTPGSRRIAYTDYSQSPNTVRTRTIDSATTDSLVYTLSSNESDVRGIDWSPAGDSLVFSLNINGYRGMMVVARAGGPVSRVARAGNGNSGDSYPTWTDQGILFTSWQTYPLLARYRNFLLRPDGRVERLRRPDSQHRYGAGMDKQ